MIEVEMSKDIRDYQPKIIGPFTKRQVLGIVIGAAYAFPIALLLPVSDMFVKIMIAMVLAAPAVMCGWVDLYGMHLEQFVIYVIRKNYLTPRKRKYKTESTFYEEIKNTEQDDNTGKKKKAKKIKKQKKGDLKYVL